MTTLRLATVDDAQPIAEMHVRTWQAAYAHVLPASFLSSLDAAARAVRWRTSLAEPPPTATYVAIDEGVIGFVSVGPDRSEPAFGEVYAIYVAPSHWSSGAGLGLMRAAQRHLVAAGFTKIRLWVLEDNPRARGFYERYGFVPDGATRLDTIGGDRPDATVVTELRYALNSAAILS
jgi:ribosomal protein S18 acetylase RimI-like enzyme